jgi:hypothetical protein
MAGFLLRGSWNPYNNSTFNSICGAPLQKLAGTA